MKQTDRTSYFGTPGTGYAITGIGAVDTVLAIKLAIEYFLNGQSKPGSFIVLIGMATGIVTYKAAKEALADYRQSHPKDNCAPNT